MLKTTSYSPVYKWVKNVYSMCAQGVFTCVSIFTGARTSPISTHLNRVQTPLLPRFLTSFTPASYTGFFNQFNLLYTQLYPLSTAPTITKTHGN